MRYISGGYYIISPSSRPKGLDEGLLPSTLLSLSQYFCEFHSDLAFMSQNVSDAREVGLREIDYMAIEKWVEDMFAKELFTYPQSFMTLATVRDFCMHFSPARTGAPADWHWVTGRVGPGFLQLGKDAGEAVQRAVWLRKAADQ